MARISDVRFNEARDLLNPSDYAGSAETHCIEAFNIITVAKMRNQPTEAAQILRSKAQAIHSWSPVSLWLSLMRAADVLSR